MSTRAGVLFVLFLVFAVPAGAQQPSPPPQGTPTPAKPPAPRTTPPATRATTPVVVTVTDQSGAPLQGATVSVTGPVTRAVTTVANGTARVLGMRPGTYRFRFEHAKFITLERDVTLRGGAAPDVDVTLSPAPEPPSSPPQPAAPQVDTVAPAAAAPGDPRYLSVVDFLDKNLIGGREPVKRDEVGCTASARTTLVQLRDSLQDEARADADEVLYVVAGQGTLRLGNRDLSLDSSTVAVVPRGTVRGLTKKGRNPLIVLSVVSGPACTK
jgi:mannose-6-phosphate isomerase-like protein (cupin superfamily)